MAHRFSYLSPFCLPFIKDGTAKKPTALIVEDNALIRTSERMLLRYDGFDVFTAPDGVKALKLFTEHSEEIDLVVTDYRLPELTGREICSLINQESPGTPIMLVSSDTFRIADPDLKDFDAVLTKPFSAEDFIEIARRLTFS